VRGHPAVNTRMGRSAGQIMTGSTVMVTACVLLALGVSSVSGIRCWECNSAYDYRCGDPYNDATTQSVDCDQMRGADMGHLPLQANGSAYKANICRKTVQTTNEVTRVIRSCGWLPNEPSMADRTCYTRTGTAQISVYHCVCYHDNCNSSSMLEYSRSVLLALAIAAFLRSTQ